MRPRFEQVTVASGQSWTLYDRQLPSFPFNWHYHPEFELTLTLNSIGERFVGDHVAHYGDGDLVLVGPNLPHAWQSRAAVDAGQPHRALVLWFTQQWVRARRVGSVVHQLLDQLANDRQSRRFGSPRERDDAEPGGHGDRRLQHELDEARRITVGRRSRRCAAQAATGHREPLPIHRMLEGKRAMSTTLA